MAVNAAQGRDERESILTVLRQHWGELEQHGVKSAAVFGSAARNELSANSDVDILVEFNRQVGLFEFVRLKLHLEKLIGREIDLVTPDALRPALSERILKEAVYVP